MLAGGGSNRGGVSITKELQTGTPAMVLWVLLCPFQIVLKTVEKLSLIWCLENLSIFLVELYKTAGQWDFEILNTMITLRYF